MQKFDGTLYGENELAHHTGTDWEQEDDVTYVEIFNITRLADFMTVYPDERTALAASM